MVEVSARSSGTLSRGQQLHCSPRSQGSQCLPRHLGRLGGYSGQVGGLLSWSLHFRIPIAAVEALSPHRKVHQFLSLSLLILM